MATSATPECEKYDVLEKIGSGSFGIIRKVRRRSDGKIMCRKEINYFKMSQREREQLHAEFSILSSLRHDNIVAYYHREHLKASQDLHIYMEYCGGGDLSRKIKDNRARNIRPTESYVWDVLAQLTMALYRCHYGEDPQAVGADVLAPPASPKKLRSKTQVMILHRDLKPDNIFLGEDDSIKLGDFGLSKAIASHDLASTYVGTPYYMSPEICAAERYGWHSDVWAMGCILYELCQNRPPFDARTHFHLVQKIKDGRVDPLPAEYSEDLRNVIMSCLQVNPSKRPTTKDIVNLPIVRILRSQRETLQVSRTLKARESLMKQKMAEAEALLTKSDAKRLQEAQELKSELTAQIRRELRAEIEAEVNDRLRREWEVKAHLEIDKRIKAEREKLQMLFDSELQRRVKKEVDEQVASMRKPSFESTSSSQAPPVSSMGAADTPSTDLSAYMSAISFESPLPENIGPIEKKATKTPFVRARTQIESPMDVQMTSPSPICASLSLSPRRAAILEGQKNLFAANAAGGNGGRHRWQPQTMSDINSETEDENELPEIPSPTRLPRTTSAADVKDPFRAPAPTGRPSFRRQSTMPAHVVAQQPTLFSNGTYKASEQNKMLPPPSPTRRPHQRPLQKAVTSPNAAGGGEDMFKAVTQKNMFAKPPSNEPTAVAPPLASAPVTGGRTLVELNQLQAVATLGPVPASAPPFSGDEPSKLVSRASEPDKKPVAVWDPEIHEMPSPFLQRSRRPIKTF